MNKNKKKQGKYLQEQPPKKQAAAKQKKPAVKQKKPASKQKKERKKAVGAEKHPIPGDGKGRHLPGGRSFLLQDGALHGY